MGFFRKLLGAAAPIVGGILGGPVGAAIGGGVSGWLAGGDKAKEQQQVGTQAMQTAQGGADYLKNSPVGQTYAPGGAAAFQQEQALLGVGGDPAASEAGYQNYLNSVGYQGQMRAGQNAITSSRAASGLLGSGSTAKALQEHGQDVASRNFNNYLAQLHGQAAMGLQAGGMVGQAVSQGASDAARYQYGANTAATETKASGWDQLLGGLGTAYDAWSAGRAKRSTAQPVSAWGAPG